MSDLPKLSQIRPLANCLRALAMDAVEQAASGHPGQPMGMADVAAVLFTRHLKFYAAKPEWPDRDRFILSGGHGSMLLYAMSYLTGYPDVTLESIRNFRQLGSICAGHPERHVRAGIEMTTGPLGQGLASAVGFAWAEEMTRARHGDSLCFHKTYVMCGDGDLQEGVTHEACALAGHQGLSNLVVLYDDNGISIDGPTLLSFTEDVCARFAAYGWATRKIDGHDPAAIDAALIWANEQTHPVLIACKTTIGFGAAAKAGTAEAHGAPLGSDEIAAARKNLNWPYAPFEIPESLLTLWREAGARGRAAYTAWEGVLENTDEATRQIFLESLAGPTPHAISKAIQAAIEKFETDKPVIATRKASQMVLEQLVPALPGLIGGSADLTGSNLTKIKGQTPYLHYGVREHGMAAIMNGLALHGGLVPYGGTFLCFADYARPALRLGALMGAQTIHVMTHDSIGLGEDGPTHQPVEHLAALRAIPNVLVLRPADAIETARAWEIALTHSTGPSVLCLTRQNLPPLPADFDAAPSDLRCGGSIVFNSPAPRVILASTGSEVEIALNVARHLAEQKIPARVISILSFELLRAQDESYKSALFLRSAPTGSILRVGIEAAIRQGWDEWIGSEGLFFGLSGFGASGPYKKLYDHFGLNAQKIAEAIMSLQKE